MNALPTIPVLAAPLIDPGAGRLDLDMPAGLTVAQIVALALPDATERDLEHMRIALVTPAGMAIVERHRWAAVRPKPGVRVVIRIVPGKQILKAVLMIVVSIAAIALGQLWAPALAGTWGLGATAWAGIIGLGVTVVGTLLVNALIPPASPKTRDTTRSDTYTISGWQNRLQPDGVIPDIAGSLRYAPPFAARSYSEIVGDVQYIRAVFCFGYTIGNRTFENTIGVQREKIEDDKYGVFAPLMQEMGRAAAVHPDELVFSTLAAGFSTECFDEQYFFDTDHPVVKDGEETSVSNMQAGSGEPWYLLDTSRAIRPLVYQERRPYVLLQKTDPTDDNVFFNKEYLYGVDGRCAAGYGLWQLAFGSKADLTPANYSLARVAMQSLKGDEGRPLAIKPTVLVVGPANEEKALTLINSATNAAGASNPWYKTVEVIMSPWVE